MKWAGILDRMTALDKFYSEIARDENPLIGAEVGAYANIDSKDMTALFKIIVGIAGGVRHATPYWISREMLEVTNHAASSFPWESIGSALRPVPFGYVEFAEPQVQELGEGVVEVSDISREADYEPMPISGLIWAIAYGKTVVISLMDKDTPEMRRRLLTDFSEDEIKQFPRFVQAASVILTGTGDPYNAEVARWGRFLGAMWTLMGQRIAVESRVRAERQERRRWLREGRREPDEIRVIRLRRIRSDNERDDDGEGFIEWHHRWIVNGHWRMQWYPSVSDHRPIWIAPYVKGPEDKPLILKHDLYALVR